MPNGRGDAALCPAYRAGPGRAEREPASRGSLTATEEDPMMQEDLYGLRLSTTQEAGQAYNAGLRRILMVQAGPEHDLRAAVRANPGFGLAHAGLALLGHEYGAAGVNVSRSLAAAAAAVERHGTERERSQVAAV